MIGGGFTAMDACRTSIRKGAKEVTCLYRRSRKEMPAHHTEVDEAEEEGVRLELLVAPVRVVTDDANKVTGIEVQRMELGEPDASGRRRPVPVEGSEFVVECDQVITAIGQYPKLDGTSEEQGVKRTRWRTIQVDDWTFQTDDPRVFAGGDVVLGAQTVIQAIAQGKKAAWSMDAYLRGVDMKEVSRQLAELKASPFLAALTNKTDLDPRISRMAEIPPVFIDMTTDVTQPVAAGRDAQARARRSARRTSSRSSSASPKKRRSAAPSCASTATARRTASATCSGTRSSTTSSRTGSTAATRTTTPPTSATTSSCASPTAASTAGAACASVASRSGRAATTTWAAASTPIVSTADNLPLQVVGCVSCGKCAETCPTGSIETNPRLLAQLRPRREPLHVLRRVRRGLPVRRPRADRLLRARRLQPHDDGARVAVRARARRRRPAARDGHRPRPARARQRARRRLGLGADPGRPGRPGNGNGKGPKEG